MTWEGLGSWWLAELASDPAYEEVVTPLLLAHLEPVPGAWYLDAGCGEGRLMRRVTAAGGRAVGVDADHQLLARASGPVVASRLPDLRCLAPETFDGAYLCLVLEHLPTADDLWKSLARVVRPGGGLALVVNHPLLTAPDSAPVEDLDGEVLWRPGKYFSHGWSDEPAGDGVVRFHHRSMGELVTGAAGAGWELRRLTEIGPSPSQIRRHPPLRHQRHIPRLLAVRWERAALVPSG